MLAIGVLGYLIAPPLPGEHFVHFERRQDKQAVDAIVVGPSYGMSIDWTALQVNGQHLHISSTDVTDAKHIALSYLEYIPNLKRVLLMTSPALAFFNTQTLDKSSRERVTLALFNHSLRDVYAYDGINGLFNALIGMVRRADHWQQVIKALTNGVTTHHHITGPSVATTTGGGELTPLNDQSIGWRLSRHMASMTDLSLQATDNKLQATAQLHALQQLAQALTQRGIDLVLVDTPISSPYAAAYKAAFQQQFPDTWIDSPFQQWAHQTANKGLCVHWITGAWQSSVESNNPVNYRDADHLNQQGAKTFSEQLALAYQALPTCRQPPLSKNNTD